MGFYANRVLCGCVQCGVMISKCLKSNVIVERVSCSRCLTVVCDSMAPLVKQFLFKFGLQSK